MRRFATGLSGTFIVAALGGCGAELTAGEVHQALRDAPYTIRLREETAGENGDGKVISGGAIKADGTAVDFAIAVEGADMPKQFRHRDYASWDKGWSESFLLSGLGGEPPPQSSRELKEETKMEITIEDELCRHVECGFP